MLLGHLKGCHESSSDALTLAHDLVDLAILLATDKFLVLVGQLDLHTDLVLRLGDEFEIRDDLQGRFDGVIGTGHGERHFVKRDVSIRVGTNIAKHGLGISRVWKLSRVWLLRKPSGRVKLTGLAHQC